MNGTMISLTKYIVRVFARVWFEINKESHFINVSKHIFCVIAFFRFMPGPETYIMAKCFKLKPFYLHEENVISAMPCDERDHIYVLRARKV